MVLSLKGTGKGSIPDPHNPDPRNPMLHISRYIKDYVFAPGVEDKVRRIDLKAARGEYEYSVTGT